MDFSGSPASPGTDGVAQWRVQGDERSHNKFEAPDHSLGASPTFSSPTSLLCSTLTKLSLSSPSLCPGCAPVRDALFQIPALFSNSHLPVPLEGASCFSGPRQPWLSSWSSLVPMCYLLKSGDEAEALGAPVSPSMVHRHVPGRPLWGPRPSLWLCLGNYRSLGFRFRVCTSAGRGTLPQVVPVSLSR